MTPTESEVQEENEVTTHWGVQLLRKDGSVYLTRWDPSYGSGYHVPYTEEEARADAARDDWYPYQPYQSGHPAERKRLVRRTEITTIVTTPWEVVE